MWREGGRECELMGGRGGKMKGVLTFVLIVNVKRLYSYSNCANVSLHNVYETPY